MMCRQWLLVTRDGDYVPERLVVLPGICRMLVPEVQVPLANQSNDWAVFDVPFVEP
jgi:hypothetical protein